MKKQFLAGFAVAAVMAGLSGTANAETFTDTIDFTDSTTLTGVTYKEITNSYTYTHTLGELTTQLYSLDDATLTIRHRFNNDYDSSNLLGCIFGELWFSSAGTEPGSIFIGNLERSILDWKIDSWELSDAVLDLMDNSSPWQLVVTLRETTSGSDKLLLDYSTLSGNYTTNPVPVPGAALLFGSGLAGLFGFWRTKKA